MDMKKMMKEAQKMQMRAAAMQEQIAEMEFTATSGGGIISVTVDGSGMLKNIKIDPEAISAEDVDILEDSILAAVNDAITEANDVANTKMNSVMGGMNIPGLM